MSNFGAARLQRGESHPSKFRAFRKSPEIANLPSPPKCESKGSGLEGEDHAADATAENRRVVEDSNVVHASRIEAIQIITSYGRDELSKEEGLSNTGHRFQDSAPASAVVSKSKEYKRQEIPSRQFQSFTISRKPILLSMPPPTGPVRFFIASLGNPQPYHATRHSAGHILLKSLQSYLSLPPLTKSKNYSGGHVSHGSESYVPQFTLWQSPATMNVSGPPLLKAYRSFLTTIESESGLPALVILHDEMETPPSQLKLRHGPTSPKGHNGIKSVQSTFQSAGVIDSLNHGKRYIKIGVGIGRPAGGTRERDDVSAFVLGQLTGSEKSGIEGLAGRLVELLEGEMARLSK